MKAFFFSLRFRLLMLVLLGVLPALGLTFYTAAEQRRRAASDIQQNALRVARLASAGQERHIEGARQLLIVMAHLPEIQGGDPVAASALLGNLLQQYTNYTNFGVIESDGRVFASGVAMPANLNLSDRAYFKRAMEKRDFAMGDYQIGRITGKASVNFGYPVMSPAGEVRRIVFAALDLEWLEQLAAQAELPSGGTLTVVDGTGTILARWPDPQRWRGKSLVQEPIWPTIAREHQGTAQTPGSDGDARLFAFTQLRGAQGAGFVSVNIGIPTEVAFAEADRILKRNLMLLGIASGLALAAAWFGGDWFILRRVGGLVQATRKLEAGDLTARTGARYGHGELGQLAHAFDAMAGALQQRGAERDRAEEALKKLNEQLEQRVADRTIELREKNDQLEADLAVAREFQLALLPTEHPDFPPGAMEQSGLHFCHAYEASGAVGGDFYAILPLSDTQAGVFQCDVMGHGVRAALVTAIIRGLVEELKPIALDPGKFLTEINRSLADVLHETGATMFATAFYMVADLASTRLLYANAGHPKPLHIRRRGRAVERLQFSDGASGPALGLFPHSAYRTAECALTPSDALVLYTDGVFEVTGSDDEEFGPDRLIAAIETRIGSATEKIFEDVLDEIRRFSASSGFEDDVCLVGVDFRRFVV